MLAESLAVFVSCLTCTQSSSRASGSASPLFFCFFFCDLCSISVDFAIFFLTLFDFVMSL